MEKNNNIEQEPITISMPLEEGQIVESYREMCNILDEPYKSGDTKKSQLSAWEGFFEWRNEGRKFIIEKIYSPHFIPTDTLRKNSKKQYNDAQKIILSMLRNKEFYYLNGAHYVSTSALTRAVGLCNENYFFCLNRKREYAEIENIDLIVLNDFFDRTWRMFKKDAYNILKGLERQALLKVSEVHLVTPVFFLEEDTEVDFKTVKITKNKSYHKLMAREATVDDLECIQEAEYATLSALGCKDIMQVFSNNLYESYKNIFNKIMFEDYHLVSVHKAFKIIFSEAVVSFIENNTKEGEKFFRLLSSELLMKKKMVARLTSEDIVNNTKKTFTNRENSGSWKPNNDKQFKQAKKVTNQIINYKTTNQIMTHREKFEK